MYEANVKSKLFKKCAFCKHWYDPGNSAIMPKSPQLGIWQYDYEVKKKCLRKNTMQKGGEFCKYFEMKI